MKDKVQPTAQIPATSSFALPYIICTYSFSSFSSPSENIADLAVSFAGASFFASANVEQAGSRF